MNKPTGSQHLRCRTHKRLGLRQLLRDSCKSGCSFSIRRYAVTVCIGLVLFSGCAQISAPRDNPFEAASAKLKQSLFRSKRPADEGAKKSQTSANQHRPGEPVGATPMLYQEPLTATADSRLPMGAQHPWQPSPNQIAQTAYQTAMQNRPMPQSQAYGQFPGEPVGPGSLPFEQPAYAAGNLRARPADPEPYWQPYEQPVAQAAYYGAPQGDGYGYPPPVANYPFAVVDGLPYAPQQYPAVELPSQSRFIRHRPPPVAGEIGQPVMPYQSYDDGQWADQAAPAMPPGEMEYSPNETMLPPQQAMPYQDQSQMDPLIYVDSLRPPSNSVIGSGTGHLAEGVGLRGSMLRPKDQTATEIAIDLDMQNQTLREQHKKISQDISDLEKELENQMLTNKKTKQLLMESNRRNELLQEDVAKLRVHVQDLEREKESIQKNADLALQQIESQLDTMLLSTMSKSRQPQTGRPLDD